MNNLLICLIHKIHHQAFHHKPNGDRFTTTWKLELRIYQEPDIYLFTAKDDQRAFYHKPIGNHVFSVISEI